MKDIYKDLNAPIYCTKLDMENYPETRYHYAMMHLQMLTVDEKPHLNKAKDVTLRTVQKKIDTRFSAVIIIT